MTILDVCPECLASGDQEIITTPRTFETRGGDLIQFAHMHCLECGASWSDSGDVTVERTVPDAQTDVFA